MGNDVLSNVNSSSITSRASLSVVERALAFLAYALKTHSGSKKSMPWDLFGSYWPIPGPIVTNNICILIEIKLANRTANQIVNRIPN